jgi:hypothetical protein
MGGVLWQPDQYPRPRGRLRVQPPSSQSTSHHPGIALPLLHPHHHGARPAHLFSCVSPCDEGDATRRVELPGVGRSACPAITQAGATAWAQPQLPLDPERPHRRPVAMRQLSGSHLLPRGTIVAAGRDHAGCRSETTVMSAGGVNSKEMVIPGSPKISPILGGL